VASISSPSRQDAQQREDHRHQLILLVGGLAPDRPPRRAPAEPHFVLAVGITMA
jgi:hypothetical protein